MRSIRVLAPLAAAVVPAFAACDALEPCSLESRAGVFLVVRDSVTALAPDTVGAVVVAIDGAYRDTARMGFADGGGGISYQLAHERPGRYLVRVENPGYRAWERGAVWVRDGRCHVRTVELVANLQPE